jgi:hypothetical protein
MVKPKIFQLLILIALIFFLLSACSNPASAYQAQLQDALRKYNKWNQESVASFNQVQETKTTGNPEVTYRQLITNTIQNHVAGDSRRADLIWDPADFELFKGQAQMVYDGARPLLTELEKMTPTGEMKDPHLILQECVKYQMNIAATILIFLNDNKFEPVNYSYQPCDTVDTALMVLRAYADSNEKSR